MIFLLIIAIIAASLNSAVLHKATLTEKGAIYKFNLFGAPVWCVCLFIASGGRLHFDANTLLWAVSTASHRHYLSCLRLRR